MGKPRKPDCVLIEWLFANMTNDTNGQGLDNHLQRFVSSVTFLWPELTSQLRSTDHVARSLASLKSLAG